MIDFQEALSKVLEHVQPITTKRVRLDHLFGYCLAEPILATCDMPSFDNSAVDGFGILANDVKKASRLTPVVLKLAGVISAGTTANLNDDIAIRKISPGQTIKLLTGAPVPDCVEAVVMREFCEETEGQIAFTREVITGENIRRRAEEFVSGQEVIPKHTMITPPVIGILASMGLTSARVYRKPKIAIIVTGNELVEPGKKLKPGQIYDSNSYAVKAAIQSFGIEDCQVYHATDDLKATKKLLSTAANQADVVISTGGVSVGDFDYVKDAAEAIGFETIFWKIAIKPGKPVYFARLNNVTPKRQVLLFGLPGNPVAALVILHKLVKPALLKIMGASNYQPTLYQACLKKPLKKKSGRMEFVRAVAGSSCQGIDVEPTKGQDSHMLSGLVKANSLIHFVKESEQITSGQTVQVEFIKWSNEA